MEKVIQRAILWFVVIAASGCLAHPASPTNIVPTPTTALVSPAPATAMSQPVTSTPTRPVPPTSTSQVITPTSSVAVSGFVQILQAGRGTIVKMALTSDGKTLAVAGSQGVRLFAAENLGFLRWFGSYTATVNSVAWSPDNTQLAVGLDNGITQIKGIADGQTLYSSLDESGGSVQEIAWSPDGTRLAVSILDEDGHTHYLRVKVIATGQELFSHDMSSGLAWSPDGKQLVLGEAACAKVIDAFTGKDVRILDCLEHLINSVVWSPDGKQIAAAVGDLVHLNVEPDNTVRIWNVSGGPTRLTLKGHAYVVNSVAWSRDGKTVASGSLDGTIRIWDTTNGQLLHVLQSHTRSVTAVAWLPDSVHLVTAGDDSTLRLWNIASGQLLRTSSEDPLETGVILSASWSPDGLQLVLGGRDSSIKVWDVAQWKELYILQGHEKPVNAVGWSPDGRRLASGSSDETIRIWDLLSKRVVQTLESPQLEGQPHPIKTLAWSPDGSRLAVGSAQYGSVQVWDPLTGQIVWTADYLSVPKVAWSPDGKLLAGAIEAHPLVIWEADGHESEESDCQGIDASWLPTGVYLLSGGTNGICVWDTQKREASVFASSIDSTSVMALSPNGRWLALTGEDGSIQIWGMDVRQQVSILEGHIGPVISLVWSPDSNLLLSSSEDGTVRLWGMPNH